VIDDADSPNVEAVIASKVEKGKYKYIRMKRNFGLFGGLYIGIKEAYRLGYDAMWLLDDDCIPEKNALERLVTIIVKKGLRSCIVYPDYVDNSGSFFTEPVSIKIGKRVLVYEKLCTELKGKLCEASGGPNIGTLLMRRVVELVGFPRPDLFFCGEGEYLSRTLRSGCKVYRYFDALVYHKRHKFRYTRLLGKTIYVSMVPVWHDYYEIRNHVFVVKHYKGLKGFLYYPVILLCVIIKVTFNDQKLRRLIALIKGVCDGFSDKLGVRITKAAESPRQKKKKGVFHIK
jgi:GT2 family glycosyltransferase